MMDSGVRSISPMKPCTPSSRGSGATSMAIIAGASHAFSAGDFHMNKEINSIRGHGSERKRVTSSTSLTAASRSSVPCVEPAPAWSRYRYGLPHHRRSHATWRCRRRPCRYSLAAAVWDGGGPNVTCCFVIRFFAPTPSESVSSALLSMIASSTPKRTKLRRGSPKVRKARSDGPNTRSTPDGTNLRHHSGAEIPGFHWAGSARGPCRTSGKAQG
jgi:hypothetical protein